MANECFRSVFYLLALTAHGIFASKILIVVPSPSLSHQKPFHIITKVLLERGHEVTLFTANPLKISNENLTEIDLSIGYKIYRQIDLVAMAQMTPAETLPLLRDPARIFLRWQFNEPAVKDFISNNQTFDLMIMEWLTYPVYYGMHHRAGSPPLVGMITLSAPAPVYHSLGNSMNPAYVPDVWVGYSDHMTFWQRMYNAYFYLRFYYMWYCEVIPYQEAMMREYFGPEPPPLYETERNYSLLIVNNHFSMEYPRPHLPNVVEITGIHVATQISALPKDIQEFMDGAEHGVIFFSLGSNVRSSDMPQETIQALVEAFRQIPQRVLWKWETDSLPNQPENLLIRKWLPQQDVLAHSNVRLFITQGGLQSMNEATYHAVPFLVIPFFSDQAHNAAKMVQAEIGVRLELADISKDSVLHSLHTVLRDTKYRDNMKRLSAIFREHKADSVERAVWWIEYVIRHQGAPHLRSAARDLHWWQLLLLDVVVFVLAAISAVAYATYYLLRRLYARLKCGNQKEKKH